ncbi:MAG: glycosyltransferase family 9 protein [Nitrospirae bacterium]|nr:glycosyltransferase family 9 protein [Nitrospirota bacterium]
MNAKVKEILIINLTRMGDLLQTTPLMSGLKKENPGVRITLLINSSFVGICKGIPFIDELIVFDMHGFRDRLLNKEYSFIENYRFLEDLINRISGKEYDLAMNLTHSRISALMISLVRAKEKRGFTVDPEGHRVIKHPWLRYFFNVVPNRDYNPFHIVDMYLKAGGVMPSRKGLIYETPREDEKKSGELLADQKVTENELLIGIHLGASKSDKTWPVSSFAALADMITERLGARILLFGSTSETDLGSEFEKLVKSRPINFIGKTGIGELAALLKKCSLLISNDTGPLHLATAAGTKVIDIFTANVHFLETGPYGEGHYVIQADIPCVPCSFNVQCSNMVCKEVIKPEIVFEVVKESMGKESVLYEAGSLLRDIQVYRTRFEDNGLLGFSPLLKRQLKKEILYRILYREVWTRDFEKTDGDTEPVYNSICRELSTFYALNNLEGISLSLGRDIIMLEHLSGLAKDGLELAGVIAEEAGNSDPDIIKLKKTWECLKEIDNKIEIAGHTNPHFMLFTTIFIYSIEALEGDDLLCLADNTRSIYKGLLAGSAYMLQLMTKLKLFFESLSDPVNGKLNTEQIHTEYKDHPVRKEYQAGISNGVN